MMNAVQQYLYSALGESALHFITSGTPTPQWSTQLRFCDCTPPKKKKQTEKYITSPATVLYRILK